MAKTTKRPKSPPPPTLMSAKRPPRIDGDDLYNWAALNTQINSLMQAKQQMAVQMLQARGFTPGPDGYLVTDDGYIVTQQDLVRHGRVQQIPGGPHPETVPPPPESLPDSES